MGYQRSDAAPDAATAAEPSGTIPLRAALAAGTAVSLGSRYSYAPRDVVSPSTEQRHQTPVCTGSRFAGRTLPPAVRFRERISRGASKRDRARVPIVSVDRDSARIPPVPCGIRETRVPAH